MRFALAGYNRQQPRIAARSPAARHQGCFPLKAAPAALRALVLALPSHHDRPWVPDPVSQHPCPWVTAAMSLQAAPELFIPLG